MKNNVLAQKKVPAFLKTGNLIRLLLILLIAPFVLYYLWTRGFVYFKFSKEVYTEYFWYRAPWLLVHVICGLTASLIGPFQFIPWIRRTNVTLHRTLGKIYLGSITLSTGVSFYLVSTARLGIVYATGLAMLGVVWFGCTFMAYIAIRKGNLQMHKEWMIKSYVLTLSFVSFRLVEDLLAKAGISEFIERKVLMAWACWAIPFFVTEVVLQLNRLFRKKSPDGLS
jgi:uncharacterized membrane protein